MKTPRKIIVHIATSADGYIARPDGDVAWLDRPRPKGNYGMPAFFKSMDTILWGRKTYAKGHLTEPVWVRPFLVIPYPLGRRSCAVGGWTR